jgi:HD-like signal output (HDOD) protein
MSNVRSSARAPVAWDLKARYALGRAVAALARELPLPLADWRRCAAEVQGALAGGAVAAGAGATLRQLREALFTAPGRDPEMAGAWREALATAAYAGAFAASRRIEPSVAVVAGLLHRAGEAAALRALALAESASGVQADASARAQIVAQYAPSFLDALVRGWRLPAEVALPALGWRRFGEFPTESTAMAVYFGNLLAEELLHEHPSARSPADGVAVEIGVSPEELARLRDAAAAVQELVQRLA